MCGMAPHAPTEVTNAVQTFETKEQKEDFELDDELYFSHVTAKDVAWMNDIAVLTKDGQRHYHTADGSKLTYDDYGQVDKWNVYPDNGDDGETPDAYMFHKSCDTVFGEPDGCKLWRIFKLAKEPPLIKSYQLQVPWYTDDDYWLPVWHLQDPTTCERHRRYIKKQKRYLKEYIPHLHNKRKKVTKCMAVTKKKTQCTRKKLRNGEYCWQHVTLASPH